MALKSDRIEAYTDISYFCNDTTAERGGIVVHATGVATGSGVAMDDSNAVVTYAAVASGRVPAGLLLNDVVNLDLTRQHINWHKDEVQTGSKVTLLRQGQVTTNMLAAGVTVGPGSGAPGATSTTGATAAATGATSTATDADAAGAIS